MDDSGPQRRWFWATLVLSSVSLVTLVFGLWELVENRFFRAVDYVTLHYLYITRGIASSLLLAFWAAWYVLRQRRRTEEELRRSRERYRGLLEVSPGAVALYDAALRVIEWNAAAERLYGLSKDEAVGQPLSTVPPEKEAELREFLRRVAGGQSVLDAETLRRDTTGTTLEVQLSLLPFREAGGQSYFLEVTSDIRERVRMRQTLLELEKLTSMGKMAAGTAHHLNTPLAAMLLRVQMMRERNHQAGCAGDLERLESGLRFCQHFVQRLLEFSRQVPLQKQPQAVEPLLRSVVSFLSPPVLAKRARIQLELKTANGAQVFADRNQLEALFSVLLSNALDAIAPEGTIVVRSRRLAGDQLEIEISDTGCGISAADFPHVFEPFFTTKGPGKGTGLGLAIARNIVREHGGSIHLRSHASEGTTAIVELPLHKGTRGDAGEQS
ncbi:MAG: PAS domain S-box protein [Acidobacteria bacterium]|nr:PAS domain S-box protein [Acidobacteriota bacterium]MBI3662676.1 PAS domain S-box protein [Acidobacteriota bacterium]